MSLLRPTLDALKAYAPTPPRPGHRLHLNESPADLPEDVKRAATERALAMDWSRYPEAADSFAEELAAADGWRADGILTGNGSNEFLQLLVFGALAPGDAVVLAAPSFSLYATQAKAAGARIVEVPLRDGPDRPFRFDVDALIEATNRERAKLVMIATPNNPTGTILSAADVARLHDSTNAILALDEAYRHFAAQDLVPLLAKSPRLVLMRTFSKSHAAAALRLGYILASPELCSGIHKLQMPYNLGAVSIELARELVRRPSLVAERVAGVVAERTRVEAELAKLAPWRLEPGGGANFVVVEHPEKQAKTIAAALSDRGILVRDLTGYAGCERCLRIAIGTREANDALLENLRSLA